jgi:hypothetical protein
MGLPSVSKPLKSETKIVTKIRKTSQYKIDNYDDGYDYDPTNVMEQVGDLLKETKPGDQLKEATRESLNSSLLDEWRTGEKAEATGGQFDDIDVIDDSKEEIRRMS